MSHDVSVTYLPGRSELQSVCQNIGGISEEIMKARQSGAAINTVSDIWMASAASAPAEVRLVVRAIIRDAYDAPQYESSDLKQQAVKKFREKNTSACIVNLRGGSTGQTRPDPIAKGEWDALVEYERRLGHLERQRFELGRELNQLEREQERLAASLFDCRVVVRDGTRFVYITASDETGTYAINGTARSVARAMGWIDGYTKFSAEQMKVLLEGGLKRCGQ